MIFHFPPNQIKQDNCIERFEGESGEIAIFRDLPTAFFFFTTYLQIFQLCLSFWTSSSDLFFLYKFLEEKEKYPKIPQLP